MLTIEKFLSEIKIEQDVKEYLNEVWKDIEQYLFRLNNYSQDGQSIFLKDYLIKENFNSSELERELYSSEIINLYDDGIFDKKIINSQFIKLLNKSVRSKEEIMNEEQFEVIRKEKNKNMTYEEYVEIQKSNLNGNYRKEIVWIGDKSGIQYAHHIPPNPQEIEKYMDDFINYYNNPSKNSELDDPIVKAVLIHSIFIKIHPFANGNGRTARILLNHYLKMGINNKYNLDLTYPPINLSKSYDLSRVNYFEKQNNIIFKEGVDNNKAINQWIKYNLMMIEEQLFYISNRLEKYDKFLKSTKTF